MSEEKAEQHLILVTPAGSEPSECLGPSEMEGRMTAQGEPSSDWNIALTPKKVTVLYSLFSSSSRQRGSENENWLLDQCRRWMVYVVKHVSVNTTAIILQSASTLSIHKSISKNDYVVSADLNEMIIFHYDSHVH